MLIRTYLDTNVLIDAWQSNSNPNSPSIRVLSDPNRQFLATSLLELETVAHAVFGKRTEEVEFFRQFFEGVVEEFLEVDESLIAEAFQVTASTDAGGMDALHIASAIRMQASQFITKERLTKPMYREKRLEVRHLGSF